MSENNNSQRYRAFISYSHTDERHARWLQRALESYRLPRHLVGRRTPEGILQARPGKIFRDRTDLSVGPDLTEHLRQPLLESRYLLVVCSPAAAASRWVNDEILFFKRQHGEGRILALVVDGEPLASLSGRPEQECLPPALRFRIDRSGNLSDKPAEPLASDIRSRGDGKRMALLKLLATMLGLGLDELARRDHQRRMQLQKLISATALVAVTILAALSYAAINARDIAEKRRLAAEDLVNFMLTDLRDRLEPIGRLDALDLVGEKVLSFYRAQRHSALNADALGRQASAMHLLGEIRDLSGDTDAAIELFSRAAVTTGELLARDPANPDRIFDHAQSVFWVGYPDYQRGHYREAQRWFDEYLQLARQLVRLEPARPAWQMELFYALNTQAVLKFRDAQYREGLELFQEAGTILAGLPDNNDNREARINNLAWIGSAYFMLGEFDSAIDSRQQELRLIDDWLAREPDRNNLLDYTMTAQNALVRLYHRTGDTVALTRYRALAGETARELVQQDPENRDYRLRAYKFHLNDALIGHIGTAEADRLLADIRSLAREMPERFEVQQLRWQAEFKLALKYFGSARRDVLVGSVGDFSRWAAGLDATGQQRLLEPLRVLSGLLQAMDSSAGAEEWRAGLLEGQRLLAGTDNRMDFNLYCGEDSFVPLLGPGRPTDSQVIAVARQCIGLEANPEVLNLSQGESYE
ncbi:MULTISPECIES: toll/interleukin-1 receptor domain-containing protein [Microbulbifer]|uniref:toll/interleukin-1 receptor domain-containing protein n=1 Tax=Microbulbifer TaxID=48073 RepID=UPI001F3670BB|nr:toll/interleukin-1 receptor domain-containing protein [Microbulbifer zhoushanensis]